MAMRAAELAHSLKAKRSGRQWVCNCPAHDDSRPSLIIFDGHTSVQLRCLAGCEPEAVIDALRRRGLWEGEARDLPNKPERAPPERDKPDYRELALEIYRAARPLIGSRGEGYFVGRGLRLPLGDLKGIARFHPACPRGKERVPAIVVLMRSIHDGIPCAIQRIFLTHDLKKDCAMMLGPAGAAAMKLAPAGPRLTICEGFETALGLEALGYGPVWALGSAGAISRFPILPGVEQLLIGADHDPVGIAAGQDCIERWGSERARGIMIEREGADFADLARAVAEQSAINGSRQRGA